VTGRGFSCNTTASLRLAVASRAAGRDSPRSAAASLASATLAMASLATASLAAASLATASFTVASLAAAFLAAARLHSPLQLNKICEYRDQKE